MCESLNWLKASIISSNGRLKGEMEKGKSGKNLTIAFRRQVSYPHNFHKHDTLDPSSRARELIRARS